MQNSATAARAILILAQVSGGEMFNPSKRGGDGVLVQISAAVTYREIREERDTRPEQSDSLISGHFYQRLLRPYAHFGKFKW